jgi:uncharacterized protein (DUF1499 family)
MIHSYLVIASAVAALWPQSFAFPVVVTTNTNLAASRATTATATLPVTTTATIITSSSSSSVSGTNTNSNAQYFVRSTLDHSSNNNNDDDQQQQQQQAWQSKQKNVLLATKTLSSPSRREWFSGTLALWTASLVGPKVVLAEESSTSPPTIAYSIRKCPTGGGADNNSNSNNKVPCLSTSNVRQLDLYLPPWTFTTSSADAMARLKGAIVADPLCDIVHQDGNEHLIVAAKRIGDVFGIVDELEFVVNDVDQVVTFRSSAPSDTTTPDFGQNRKRLDDIRKRAGIFGLMGESLNSADSVSEGAKGYGPVGQLKAFYGLQSGGGFEDVFREN